MSWPRRSGQFRTRAEGHGKRRMIWLCRACSAWIERKLNQCPECGGGELIYCASAKEAKRAAQLLLEERAGLITGLQFQPTYRLLTVCQRTGRPVESGVSYRPDAVYTRNGELVVEDVKGRSEAGDDPVFHVKRKLFEAAHGVQITIVRGV